MGIDDFHSAFNPKLAVVSGRHTVRGHLPQSRYVRDFRRGEREEGGDGVTIAMLKTDGV